MYCITAYAKSQICNFQIIYYIGSDLYTLPVTESEFLHLQKKLKIHFQDAYIGAIRFLIFMIIRGRHMVTQPRKRKVAVISRTVRDIYSETGSYFTLASLLYAKLKKKIL